MEKNFQTAVGKSAGEVIRDITEFLSSPCVIHPTKKIDLCRLLPDLNMYEQFSYALLSEATLQGWSPEKAERFYRQACSSVIEEARINRILWAFEAQKGAVWNTYTQKYGNQFSLFDDSYWSNVLSLGIDCDKIDLVLRYLRQFTVVLMEFAYMENNNPSETYTWGYYESFRKMLDDFLKPQTKDAQAPIVRAIGGSAGKRVGKSYFLSLGVDLENPDPTYTALDVNIDITLKDKDGNVITVIRDRLFSIPPKTIYHYGITRHVRGAATATLSTTVKAGGYRRMSDPLPQLKLLTAKLKKDERTTYLTGTLASENLASGSSAVIHYQFLNAENQIIGGGNIWDFETTSSDSNLSLSTSIPVPINGTAKVILSSTFDPNSTV